MIHPTPIRGERLTFGPAVRCFGRRMAMTCGAAIATAGDADRLLDESAAASSITCLRLRGVERGA